MLYFGVELQDAFFIISKFCTEESALYFVRVPPVTGAELRPPHILFIHQMFAPGLFEFPVQLILVVLPPVVLPCQRLGFYCLLLRSGQARRWSCTIPTGPGLTWLLVGDCRRTVVAGCSLACTLHAATGLRGHPACR